MAPTPSTSTFRPLMADLPAGCSWNFLAGCHLEQWHLQFLKIASHLLTVVKEVEHLRRARAAETAVLPEGWKRLVVRYLDRRVLKGTGDCRLHRRSRFRACVDEQ